MVQASEEVLMQGGKLLALVIIMLSALEEQVSGFCFFVFVFGFFWCFLLKKNDQKEVLRLNSSGYCSLRITKANAVTRRTGEKRKGCFWSLCHLLEGTRWTLVCGSGVPGALPGAAHTFREVTGPPAPLQSRQSGSPTGGEVC